MVSWNAYIHSFLVLPLVQERCFVITSHFGIHHTCHASRTDLSNELSLTTTLQLSFLVVFTCPFFSWNWIPSSLLLQEGKNSFSSLESHCPCICFVGGGVGVFLLFSGVCFVFAWSDKATTSYSSLPLHLYLASWICRSGPSVWVASPYPPLQQAYKFCYLLYDLADSTKGPTWQGGQFCMARSVSSHIKTFQLPAGPKENSKNMWDHGWATLRNPDHQAQVLNPWHPTMDNLLFHSQRSPYPSWALHLPTPGWRHAAVGVVSTSTPGD